MTGHCVFRAGRLAAVLALMLLVLPTVSAAADAAAQDNGINVLGEDLAVQREGILDEMRPKGLYAELGQERLDAVVAGLAEMQAIVGDAVSVHDLTPEQRAELFNLQEEVNTLLTEARSDSRIKCKRFATVGTRLRKTTHCHTVAHWERLRTRSGQDVMERIRGTREQKQ